MTDNRRQALDLLAQGKITVEEAKRLLAIADQPSGSTSGNADASEARMVSSKYLREVVGSESEVSEGSGGEPVNIRVPMALIRTGVRLASLLPTDATNKVNETLREKGMATDLRNLKPERLEQPVDALTDLEVAVRDGNEKVRIFVE